MIPDVVFRAMAFFFGIMIPVATFCLVVLINEWRKP